MEKNGEVSYKFDILSEELFPLAELAQRCTFRRLGKPPSKAWAGRLVSGRITSDGRMVALPTTCIAGVRCTSMGAWGWYCRQFDHTTTHDKSAPRAIEFAGI